MSKKKDDTVLDALDAIESDEDLLQLFIKPVTDMAEDELEAVYKKIQAKRKKKIPRGREKTELDIMLGKLTPELAEVVLQKLTEQDEADAKTKAEAEAESKSKTTKEEEKEN